MPEGLTQDGVALLENARKNGVKVSAVNIMAMDYGPAYDGDMGQYAIQAATATQQQVKSALGIVDDAEAWRTVAVTPMIGVNDVKVEVFTAGRRDRAARSSPRRRTWPGCRCGPPRGTSRARAVPEAR